MSRTENSPPVVVKCLGTQQRLHGSKYQVQAFVVSDATYSGRFKDSVEFQKFTLETREIKNNIDDMTYKKEWGKMSQQKYETSLKDVWLPGVAKFVEHWGKHMVPGDIRNACNDVERSLHVPLITWPDYLVRSLIFLHKFSIT